MTRAADALRMVHRRRPLLVLLPLMALGSCAGVSETSSPEVRTDRAASPGRGQQMISLHDVRDLVEPQGDEERVAELAQELHAIVAFAYPDVDPDAKIVSKGTAVVVVGVREIHDRIRAYLSDRRRGVTPNGI